MRLSAIGRSASILALGTIVLAVGCTETDPSLQRVGGLSLYPTGGTLAEAKLDDPGIQYAKWELGEATLTYDDFVYDLLRGEPSCTISDAAVALPIGVCLNGIVVGSTQGSTGMLVVETNLELRRMEPLDLPDGGDFDMDGVLNEDDLCKVSPDPDNLDDNDNGIGDACESVIDVGGRLVLLPDQDLDGISDTIDNCPFVANDDQADGDDPPDGIGDACTTEVAIVDAAGGPIRVVVPDLDVVVEDGQRLFLNLDFNFETALDCDWASGTCTLDPAQAEVCALSINNPAGCL